MDTQIEQILNFWFPTPAYQSFWFNATPQIDQSIRTQFGSFHHQAEQGRLPLDLSPSHQVGLIILYDQFTRNLHRGQLRDIYTRNDHKALSLSRGLIQGNHDLNLPMNYRYFILIPLRHTRKFENLNLVFDRLRLYAQTPRSETDQVLLTKMIQASQRDINYLPETIQIHRPQPLPLGKSTLMTLITHNQDIIDDTFYNLRLSSADNDLPELMTIPLSQCLKTQPYLRPETIVGVSLSGGVDSMVALTILVDMRRLGLIQDVYAIHLVHGNRPENTPEAQFLQNYCQLLQVTLITKTLYYLRRTGGQTQPQPEIEIADRNFYETLTKQLRFDLYRQVMTQFHIKGVVLGHHKGDVVENTFSNLMRGRNLLGLANMTAQSTIDGAEIWRPMLGEWKQVIYDCAYQYQIPFFKDSTPKWSNRGHLRNQLFPLIQSIYGSGFLSNLHQISQESSQWQNIIESNILAPIYNQITYAPLGAYVKSTIIRDLPIFLLGLIMTQIFHHLGHHMIRTEGIHHLVTYLQQPPNGNYIKFSNQSYGVVQGETLYIFSRELFTSEHRYDVKETHPVPLTFDQHEPSPSLKIGRWQVTITPRPECQIHFPVDYLDILKGYYVYTTAYVAPMTRLGQFRKHDPRRKVFTQIQGIVRDHIPMIGSGRSSQTKRADMEGPTYVVECRFI